MTTRLEPGGPSAPTKNILDAGANPDGRTLNTAMVQRAIDEIHLAGGGVVYAPPGVFLTGGLQLKSGVTLYLEAGCTLLGSPSIDDYAYHPGPPRQGDANGHHVLFAQDAENVTICGPGTIDGQGAAYWEPAVDREPVRPEDAWKEGATGHFRPKNNNRRPSPMVEFAGCRNVRVRDITLRNSSGWTLRPVACESVVIDAVRIRNPIFGPNTDGLDITASRNVFVSNCDIVTGDDAICLKSENPYGELLPTKNVTITNCVLTTSCNGFKMGTATHGAFQNILFTNSTIYSDADAPMNTRPSAGICVEMVDGGSVDGVLVSNIRMENVRAPIFVRLGERRRREGTLLRNVVIEGVEATGAIVSSSITGVPGLRPTDITVRNSRIRTVERGDAAWSHRTIPEEADQYPEARMMGRLPSYGFFIRHADRIRLRDVELMTDLPDGRPAVVCDDVDDLILSDLELAAPTGDAPVIELRDTRRALLTGMRPPPGHPGFVEVSGARSTQVVLQGNSVVPGRTLVRLRDGAPPDSATAS
jgi:polygalacturonase